MPASNKIYFDILTFTDISYYFKREEKDGKMSYAAENIYTLSFDKAIGYDKFIAINLLKQ